MMKSRKGIDCWLAAFDRMVVTTSDLDFAGQRSVEKERSGGPVQSAADRILFLGESPPGHGCHDATHTLADTA